MPFGVRPDSELGVDYCPLPPWFGIAPIGLALGGLLYPPGRAKPAGDRAAPGDRFGSRGGGDRRGRSAPPSMQAGTTWSYRGKPLRADDASGYGSTPVACRVASSGTVTRVKVPCRQLAGSPPGGALCMVANFKSSDDPRGGDNE